MAFKIDQQTLKDLSIKAETSEHSLLALYQPVTLGGTVTLKAIADNPLTTATNICQRLEVVKFLQEKKIEISITKQDMDFAEFYLNQPNRKNNISRIRAFKTYIKNSYRASNDYYVMKKGVDTFYGLIFDLRLKLKSLTPPVLLQIKEEMNILISNFPVRFQQEEKPSKFTVIDYEELDYVFRYTGKASIKRFLEQFYILDVLIAVAKISREKNYCFPEISEEQDPCLELVGFFHPLLKQAVVNDISFSPRQNMCFISGANMAGKSTALKAIAICTYLAHLGFPVPAQKMKTSVYHGLFTTINLSDNILAGHSHFYSEVLRIKQIALMLKENEKMLVIFDELFRGTNVKDAYDASIAVISAFGKMKKAVFVISTHVIETADALQHLDGLSYRCFLTHVEGNQTIYDYKLRSGVAKERLGMKIIQESGLFDII